MRTLLNSVIVSILTVFSNSTHKMTENKALAQDYRRLSKIAAATCSALLLLSANAFAAEAAAAAEDEADDKDAIELKATTVRPDYVEIERLRETKEIIVIPKEDIVDQGNRTISDVLSGVPGITVDTAAWGSIDIRGQGAESADRNLQVLLDGAPITTLINHPHSTNYDVVPVEQLERIEVIPGGGSVIYGAGTAGGVVNITTNLRGMKEPKTYASAEWNSDGYRLSAGVGARVNEHFSFLGTATKLERDLWFDNTYRNSEYYSGAFRWDITDKQSLTMRVSRLDEESQFLKLATPRNIKNYGKHYKPADKTVNIGVDENGNLIKKKIPGYLNGDRTINSYNATYTNDITDWMHFTGDVFYSDGDFRNNSYWDQVIEQESKGAKLKLDFDYWNGSNLLVGFDWTDQEADFDYIGSYKRINGKYTAIPYSFHYEKKTAALYALNTLKWGDFTFTQGLRREKTDWKYDKVGNNITGADTSGRWNTAAELSAAWHYRDTGRLYARYERGYTMPDGLMIADQRIVNGEKLYVTTKAEDEKYDMFEIGLRDKIGPSTVNLTGWTSYTDNQMYRMYVTGVNDAQTLNLLKTRRYGIDLSFQQTFGRLELSESYSWMKGHSDYTDWGASFMDSIGKAKVDWTKSGLQKVPQHSIALKAKYNFTDEFSGTVKYTYFGKYNNYVDDAEKEDDGVVGSHQVVDLSFHYKPWKYLDIYAGVTNLFNEKYYEYVSVGESTYSPGRERTFFVGLRGTY